MRRRRRVWWLVLGVAGLLVAGGVAAVVFLRHDGFEAKVAQIGEGTTVDDVVRIMGRQADEQGPVLCGGDLSLSVMRWVEGRQVVQITFYDPRMVLEVRCWENETLLERAWRWLGW